MLTSTFFGHRDEDYFPYGEKIEAMYIVFRLKEKYPYIRNTMILSYSRQLNVSFPAFFDDAVYLLGESKVPPQYAIPRTNQKLVDLSNYIVSGVNHDSGGAFTACSYARKKGKLIINIYE